MEKLKGKRGNFPRFVSPSIEWLKTAFEGNFYSVERIIL